MIKIKNLIIVLIMLATGFSMSNAQTKLAQTGFNFLDITSEARGNGMADAMTSLSGYSGALFHNPASMAEVPTFLTASFNMNQWIADINYLSASVLLAPSDRDFGVFGFSVQAADYGDVQGTMVANTPQGYVDTEVFSPSAIALGLGYAKALNDKFSVGAHIRWAQQKLGNSVVPSGSTTVKKENKTSAVAFDFGTVYKTGFKSIAFGMSIRNYSSEVKYEQESFQLPLIFTLGISANVLDFFEMENSEHSVLLSIDATHPRSRPEELKVGLEYTFTKLFSVRAGYASGHDEQNFTFGFGIEYMGVGLDYAYTPFGIFDKAQRFSARISL